METISSFEVDHIRLLRGVYVSRLDQVGSGYVTTFDIRMKEPNRESVLATGVCHAIEHIGATYLRCESSLAPDTIYWGPMGCRTGFYAIFAGKKTPQEIAGEMRRLFRAVCEHRGPIPGATPEGCGNYSDMDLEGARAESGKFLTEVLENLDAAHTRYPE